MPVSLVTRSPLSTPCRSESCHSPLPPLRRPLPILDRLCRSHRGGRQPAPNTVAQARSARLVSLDRRHRSPRASLTSPSPSFSPASSKSCLRHLLRSCYGPVGGRANRCPAAVSCATAPPPLFHTAPASRSSASRSAGGTAAAVFDPAADTAECRPGPAAADAEEAQSRAGPAEADVQRLSTSCRRRRRRRHFGRAASFDRARRPLVGFAPKRCDLSRNIEGILKLIALTK